MSKPIPTQPVLLELGDSPGAREKPAYFEGLLQALGVRDGEPGWPDRFGEKLRLWHEKRARPIRTLSLFSGAGGLDLGFHDAGFKVITMVEVDERHVRTLKANVAAGFLEGAVPLCMDIKDFRPDPSVEIDFVIGGPPCQTFSAAGRRAEGALGTLDPRGRLFQEYVRVIKETRPKGFLFENVYGILDAQKGKAWEEVIRTFQQLGYELSYRVLDAADYGVPQHRERLFIVGHLSKKFLFPRPTHGPDSPDKRPYYTPRLALQGVDDPKPAPIGGRYGHLLPQIPPGLNYTFFTKEMGHPRPIFAWRSKFSDFLYKADPDMPVRAIKARAGLYTGPFHWENRPFSIGELKRLQTFPDNYALPESATLAREQLGNAVPTQLARMLALAVAEQLFEMPVPSPLDYLDDDEELGFRKRKRALTAYYRMKAQQALAALPSLPQPELPGGTKSGSLTASVDDRFSLRLSEAGSPENPKCLFGVEWELGGCKATVKVRGPLNLSSATGEQALDFIELYIDIDNGHSFPELEKAYLFLSPLSEKGFVLAWKFFEYLVRENGIRADLVQLNGYYQYKPRLTIRVNLSTAPSGDGLACRRWKALTHVLEGKVTRRPMPQEELMEMLGLADPHETLSFLVWLKEKLGYEVRSRWTNPNLKEHHFLIPYAFPTLSAKSVQLRKVLIPRQYLERSPVST